MLLQPLLRLKYLFINVLIISIVIFNLLGQRVILVVTNNILITGIVIIIIFPNGFDIFTYSHRCFLLTHGSFMHWHKQQTHLMTSDWETMPLSLNLSLLSQSPVSHGLLERRFKVTHGSLMTYLMTDSLGVLRWVMAKILADVTRLTHLMTSDCETMPRRWLSPFSGDSWLSNTAMRWVTT